MTDKRKILVVDDDPVVLETILLVLQHNGFDVKGADNAEDALTKARFEPPDILISDILLPGLNGIDAAIRLRKFLPDCRVLLISGDTSATEALQNARAGGHVFEVLPKPTSPEVLLETLNRGHAREQDLFRG